MKTTISKIKLLSIAAFLGSQSAFAGLCADVSSPTRFDIESVEEYLWTETNIHSLGAPDATNSLDSATQIQVIENSLSYKVPYELILDCQWAQSNTQILRNYGSDEFSTDEMTQYFKIRDANKVDVENTGNVSIGNDINYWLHQVSSEADTTKDGYERIDESSVSLIGTYFPESEDGMFDMWYASIFVSNDDGTQTSKLANSFTIRNDSLKALEAIQGAITEASYPHPTFTSELQLLRLRFKQSEDQTIGLAQVAPQALFEIQDNLVLWENPQAKVEIFHMDGRVAQVSYNSNITSFESLPNGHYILRNADGFQMRISRF